MCENLTLYRSCDTGSAEDNQRKKEEGKTAEKKSKFEDKAQDSRRSIEQHKKRNITHSSLRRESVSNKTQEKTSRLSLESSSRMSQKLAFFLLLPVVLRSRTCDFFIFARGCTETSLADMLALSADI